MAHNEAIAVVMEEYGVTVNFESDSIRGNTLCNRTQVEMKEKDLLKGSGAPAPVGITTTISGFEVKWPSEEGRNAFLLKRKYLSSYKIGMETGGQFRMFILKKIVLI